MSPKFGQIYVCWQLTIAFHLPLLSLTLLKDTEAETMGSNLEPWPHSTPPKINILEPQSRQVSLPQRIYYPRATVGPQGPRLKNLLRIKLRTEVWPFRMALCMNSCTWHAILWSEPPCLLRVETPGRVEQDCCHRIFLRQDSINFGLRITSFATPKGHNKFWTWNGPGGGFKTLWNILISRCKYANVHKAPYQLNFMNSLWIEKWPHFFDEKTPQNKWFHMISRSISQLEACIFVSFMCWVKLLSVSSSTASSLVAGVWFASLAVAVWALKCGFRNYVFLFKGGDLVIFRVHMLSYTFPPSSRLTFRELSNKGDIIIGRLRCWASKHVASGCYKCRTSDLHIIANDHHWCMIRGLYPRIPLRSKLATWSQPEHQGLFKCPTTSAHEYMAISRNLQNLH